MLEEAGIAASPSELRVRIPKRVLTGEHHPRDRVRDRLEGLARLFLGASLLSFTDEVVASADCINGQAQPLLILHVLWPVSLEPGC